jgi:glycosyltransferase involved in cell wall biosynthesis
MPTVSLIISTYEQPDYLARVLGAVSLQTEAADEVLLADDGSGEETRQLFTRWAAVQERRVEHVWQKHEGFRKARILNQTIARAQGQYIVFLDGDTLPHPRFVADHQRLAAPGAFVQGHRALVEQRAAAWFGLEPRRADTWRALFQGQLKGWQHAFRWPWPLVRARRDLRGIRGCNLGIWRADLVRVNGHNEAFVGWGREDSELALRLMNSGVKRLDARGWALSFHLWHPPASRDNLVDNDQILARALAQSATRCECGLAQHWSAPSTPHER